LVDANQVVTGDEAMSWLCDGMQSLTVSQIFSGYRVSGSRLTVRKQGPGKEL
jgi:hypothetical protein